MIDKASMTRTALMTLWALFVAAGLHAQSAEPPVTRGAEGPVYASCFPPTLHDSDWERLIAENPTLRTPARGPQEPWLKFLPDTIVWEGDGNQAPGGRAQPAHLTYSFPDDGTPWGLPAVATNDLNAHLLQTFVAISPGQVEPYAMIDLGREYMRQALASWQVVGGVTFDEVADDNSPMDEDVTRSPTRGDLRIGGYDQGPSSLGYNAFPSSQGASMIAGSDMALNTYYFSSLFADPANSFRFFRHTVAHEHGHGLGFIHVAPCFAGQIMEPIVPFEGYEPLSVDERRGVGRTHGDRHAGNHSQETAADLGDFGGPSFKKPSALIQRHLSLNGANGFGDTHQDWFAFSLGEAVTATLIVEPTGGTYTNGRVGPDCSPICDAGFNRGGNCVVTADEAGDLVLELYSTSGLIATADSQPPGAAETLSELLVPGKYFIRVFDQGPNPFQNQTVQLYDLTLRPADWPARPRAVAGINKRVAAGKPAFFMGDIHSHATEPGATLVSYAWDLDGDGIFDTRKPRPIHTYVAAGQVPVTLRVTDSNGRNATDTILVTVY